MKYKVLSSNPFPGLAGKHQFYCLRHLQPALTERHGIRQVGTSYAGGERSQSPVSTCVRIRAYNQVSGKDKPPFGKKGVFHTHFPEFEIIGYPELLRELFQDLSLVSAFHILRRQKMVRHQHYLVLVKDLFLTQLAEFSYRYGACYIVPEAQVYLCHYEISGGDLLCPYSMRKKYLFAYCVSHVLLPISICIYELVRKDEQI